MPDLHLISPSDLTDSDRAEVISIAQAIKASDAPLTSGKLRVGGMYFNPSLRTRTSFEGAVALAGGRCQTLNVGTDTWGLELDPHAVMDGDKAENVVDAARVLGQMFHLLGVRSFRGTSPWAVERTEPVLRAFADHAGIPVISLEGTTHHPCQGLADLLTLHETFGPNLKGLPVALCWAWHPRALPAAVPHTFLLQAALAGCDVSVVHPPGFDLDDEIVGQARHEAQARGGALQFYHDRQEGLRGRQVVYVKSWGGLHAQGPTDPALRDGWLLDAQALSTAPDARVMHCLPVRRNVVISQDVLDSSRAIITQQAGNRLWAQAGLIAMLARKIGITS